MPNVDKINKLINILVNVKKLLITESMILKIIQ